MQLQPKIGPVLLPLLVAAFAAILALCNPNSLLNPIVIASLVVFVATAVLTRRSSDELRAPDYFRLQQSISIAMTLVGLAVFNFIQAVGGEVQSGQLEWSGTWLSVTHLATAIGGIFLAAVASFAGAYISRIDLTQTPQNQRFPDSVLRWKMGVASYAVFLLSAVAFSSYVATSIPSTVKMNDWELGLMILVCAAVGLVLNATARTLKPDTSPHVLIDSGQTLVPVGHRVWPDTFSSIIQKGTPIPCSWTFVDRAVPLLVKGAPTGRFSYTILQGCRPIASENQRLLEVSGYLEDGERGQIISIHLDIDREGTLTAKVFSQETGKLLGQERLVRHEAPVLKFSDRCSAWLRKKNAAVLEQRDLMTNLDLEISASELNDQVEKADEWLSRQGSAPLNSNVDLVRRAVVEVRDRCEKTSKNSIDLKLQIDAWTMSLRQKGKMLGVLTKPELDL